MGEGVGLPEGTVTFLFTDVEGSTRLWQRDPVGAGRAMERHDALVEDGLARHGGVRPRDQGEGDSVVAVFRRAADALACAVDLQRAFDAERWPAGCGVRVRMGLHTGEAELVGENYRGSAVIRGARIRNLAHGGQVVMSETTAQVVGDALPSGVTLVDVGSHPLKGLDRPERIFQVHHPELPSEFPPLASPLGPPAGLPSGAAIPLPSVLAPRSGVFAGRADQLDELRARWDNLDERGGCFVGITGEPGIGKSRLVSEFAALVHNHDATVLAGGCSPEPLRPFEPFADAIRSYLRAAHCEEPATHLGRLTQPLAALVPDLGATAEAASARGVRAGGFDEIDERAVLFDAVTELFAQIAENGPVLLVLEDLHWATRPTLLLLRALLQSDRTLPLMVVGTYRDVDVDRNHPLPGTLAELARAAKVERISLAGIDTDAVLACLHATSDTEHDSLALARTLRDRAGGNPLFVRELISDLDDDHNGQHLPDGVREAIGRRLDRLPASTRAVLRRAAVAGPAFDLPLLEVLAAQDEPPDALLDDLEAAMVAGLIREAADDPDGFAFTHALVRETLEAEISSARRRRLHAQVVDAIAATKGESEAWLPTLAYHAAQAARPGDCEPAVRYAVRAGRSARLRLAPEEARQIVERALRILAREPNPPAEWEAELRLELADALWADPDHDLPEQATQRQNEERAALAAARRAQDPALIARAANTVALSLAAIGRPDPTVPDLYQEALAALGDQQPSLRARLLADLASYWMGAGRRPDLARRCSDDALRLAEHSGDLPTQWIVLNERYIMSFGDPPSDEKAALFATLLDVTARLGAGEVTAEDAHGRGWAELGSAAPPGPTRSSRSTTGSGQPGVDDFSWSRRDLIALTPGVTPTEASDIALVDRPGAAHPFRTPGVLTGEQAQRARPAEPLRDYFGRDQRSDASASRTTGERVVGVTLELEARELLVVADPAFRERFRTAFERPGHHAGFALYAQALVALLDGAFDRAEHLNEEGLARVGKHDDMMSVGLAQLFLLRREQGRVAELLPMAEQALDAFPALEAFGAALALARAELEDLDVAGEMFDAFAASGFEGLLVVGITRPVSLFLLAELAARLDANEQAGHLYTLFRPYAGTMVVAGYNACCIGAADRGLGQLATVLGRFDDAAGHFRAALAMEERLDAPPLVARTCYWYGHLLARRRHGDDLDDAHRLFDRSRSIAAQLSMAMLQQEADTALANLASPTG